MLDVCDVCKKDSAVIHVEDDADYCPACFRKMLLDVLGEKNVFDYSKYVTVREKTGDLHSFYVAHKTVGQMQTWEAVEQGGDYKFMHMSFEDENGTDVACDFLDKVMRGVSSKSLRYIDPNKLRARLADKGTITIADSNDSMMEISFIVDGERFTGHEFVKLLAGYEGFNMRYQFHDPSDNLLAEDEYLMPVIITYDGIIEELRAIIDKYTVSRYITSDFLPAFEKEFVVVENKLSLFLAGEKRRDAVNAGKEMMHMINRLESDNVNFPKKYVDRLEMMIFPYGHDERDNFKI